MSLTDVNFSEGEAQDFLLELADHVYSGSINDFLVDGDSEPLTNEIQAGSDSGGNIFIMSE